MPSLNDNNWLDKNLNKIETLGLCCDDLTALFDIGFSQQSLGSLSFKRKGIFQLFDGGDIYYIKRSDKLSQPFSFDSKESSEIILDAYCALKEAGVYFPDSKFMTRKNNHDKNYYLLSVMPDLEIIGYQEFGNKIFERKTELIVNLVSKKFGVEPPVFGDFRCCFNWGKTKNGNCYFHDLHVLPIRVYNKYGRFL